MEGLVFLIITLTFVSSYSALTTIYIPECVSNEECEADRVCANQKCVNPCTALCVANNTVCSVVNHVAMCSCSPGSLGQPTIGCNVAECMSNEDCETDRVCVKNKCVNPCPAVCGVNSTKCVVLNHVATCFCSNGHSDHSVTGCIPSRSSMTTFPTGSRKKQFYLATKRKVNWYGAFLGCVRNNSQLASVESEEELLEINHKIHGTGNKSNTFWVSGYNYEGQEGLFIWTSTGKPIDMTSTLWQPGQPNNYNNTGQHCINLYEDPGDRTAGFRLSDRTCSEKKYFICQY